MIIRYTSPARFMRIGNAVLPWCAWGSIAVIAVGLYLALITAPPDYQQGDSARIMYVHVPAAWMALNIYLFVAAASGVALVWRHPLAEIAARSAAPIGAAFTFVCLATGSLWGRPMWGTWWVWDARLTSVLVLFFLYLGYIALVNAFDDPARGGRAGSVLAMVGVVNLPIIKFSVDWWNTLHQPASVLRLGKPTIATSMLVPLLVMALGFMLLFVTLLIVRMGTEFNERKSRALRFGSLRARVPARPRSEARRTRRGCGDRAMMNALGTYFAMGGYGVYVWPAYALTATVLGGFALFSWHRRRDSVRSLDRLQHQGHRR